MSDPIPSRRPADGPGYFAGTWQMVRIIENVSEGIIGEFWGEAEFRPDDAGLICREQGVLRFRGADYHAERASLWRFPAPGVVEVRYEDGREFHSFLADDPHASHDCGPDRYEVGYEFWTDAWTAQWAVSGPAKDYVMTTRYTRVSPATAARTGGSATTSSSER